MSAILWDIPWGASWEETCKRTPHPQLGLSQHCDNNGFNEWGSWSVRDPSCGAWCGTTMQLYYRKVGADPGPSPVGRWGSK
jgi:hypothetical protein